MTEITPQQMIEFLCSYKEEYGVIHMATPPDGMFEAIRQFIASHQEVRDAALESAALEVYEGSSENEDDCCMRAFERAEKAIRALKGKP